MFDEFMNKALIPTLIGLVALYFAYRVMVLKDTKSIRGKNKPEPQDKEGYCRDSGRLLIFFAIGTFLMGVLETINPVIAFVQIVVWIVIMTILWRRINNTYY